jgi:hypothetical protein
MFCPTCKQGRCEIEPVAVEMPIVADDILLSEFDMNLLNALKIEEPQYPNSLAQELDCKHQKTSKRAIKLKGLGLVDSKKKTLDPRLGERTYYWLTDKARSTYFEEYLPKTLN